MTKYTPTVDRLVVRDHRSLPLLHRRMRVLSHWHGRQILGIHFGTVPASGISRRSDADPKDGLEFKRSISGAEIGLSVFPVRKLKNGQYHITDQHTALAIDSPATIAHLLNGNRPTWLVRGKVVDLGPDGEPIIELKKVLHQLDRSDWTE